MLKNEPSIKIFPKDLPETSVNPFLVPPKKRSGLKTTLWLGALLGFVGAPLAAIVFYAITIYPTLPNPAELKDVSYQVPLKILTKDGKLISEIGTDKRLPLDYTQIPERMTQAIISAEDEHFFEHSGVDYKGLARAAYELISTGSKQSGGSTITMQVARNFFLSNEKTYLRKLNEIVLAYKIENELSKKEILALYLNKIFLGYRSYGVAAAAQTYYGKTIDQLNLDEFAMIAGLPKAPSAFNPIANATRAKLRRDYVLRRMQEENYISVDEMLAAQAVEVNVKLTGTRIDVEASYVAEMARAFALDKFGEDALKNGLTIITTVDSHLQQEANQAVREGLQEYERRHGYRGSITQLALKVFDDNDSLLEALQEYSHFGGLNIGVVTGFGSTKEGGTHTTVMLKTGEIIEIPFKTMDWAAKYIDVNRVGKKPSKPQDVLAQGDVIYLQWLNQAWQLAQDPLTEAALVSLNPNNGQILALVGGFDYFRSKFNRATQSKRQVGSNIKPFLYSAALENGMTAATVINDAPVVFHDAYLEDIWRPENYSGKFYGPTRLREALVYSRNLVSIRTLQAIGIETGSEYLKRFGFPLAEINKQRNLSLSLGAVEFSPLNVAQAYSVFANSGYQINPHIILEVRDFKGEAIYTAQNPTACASPCANESADTAPRVIEERNAYIMTSIMQDVIRRGSGKAANVLKREDIAGKTGTTNDQKDAWFSGYSPNVSTTVWAGFDQPSTLGRAEVGGRAALPIWIDYMKVALANTPNQAFNRPPGLVNILIDPETGQALPAGTPGGLSEIFREENAPAVPSVTQKQMQTMTDELFE
ncbi:penicillin-binding protein 1A [Thiomicrorhabdus aquaedulcis]|uniref:penicillin-binding protein 1A n=1 Tax=Thiomicrorhabdus aquaedulcis TaxID=2211106 RepID=UPI001E4470FA|nr:penicillin-binding protein 1A [Thiomicrorhabdus aquaedulcis]